jgi:hypothetical protein
MMLSVTPAEILNEVLFIAYPEFAGTDAVPISVAVPVLVMINVRCEDELLTIDPNV